MTRQLISKVQHYGTYDTRNYRYVYDCTWTGATIRRIKRDALGTMAALHEQSDTCPDGWQTTWAAKEAC